MNLRPMPEGYLVEPLKRLDILLVKEIHKLDRFIAEVEEKKYKIPIGITEFTNFVIHELFPDEEHFAQDFRGLRQAFIQRGSSEKQLRIYFRILMEKWFEYDPLKKKTNLDELSSLIVKEINKFVEQNPSILRTLACDMFRKRSPSKAEQQRAAKMLVVFVVSLLVSGVASKFHLTKLDPGERDSIIRIATKIYIGNSLGENQFAWLNKYHLLGCILFRGGKLRLDEALRLVSKQYHTVNTLKFLKGSSWTAEYKVANTFAAGLDGRRAISVSSIENFVELLAEGKKLFRLDGVAAMNRILEFLKLHSRLDDGQGIPLLIKGEQKIIRIYRIGVVLSRPIDTRSLQYMGDWEKEILMLPKKFKIIDQSIDAFISCRLDPA